MILEQALRQWDDPYAEHEVEEAEEIIHALREQTAVQEVVIKTLQDNISSYRKDMKDQMIQNDIRNKYVLVDGNDRFTEHACKGCVFNDDVYSIHCPALPDETTEFSDDSCIDVDMVWVLKSDIGDSK